MDVRDDKEYEAELHRARAARDAILHSSMDAILIMRADGTIEDTNAAAERMFRRSRAEMIDVDMAEMVIPAGLREAHRRGLARYLETGESRILGRRLEMTAIRADGGEFPVELTVARLDDPIAPRFIGYVRDVTEHRRAEQALRERTRLASLSADVGLALTTTTSLDQTLQACAQAVVTHLGAAFARVWTLNKEEQILELCASAGMYTHLDGLHGRIPVGTLKIGTIARTRQPHLTNQVVGEPGVSEQAWAEREGMVAFAGYPLLIEDEPEGVLAMFARRELSDSDFEALAIVAHGLAVGIARYRVMEAMRENQSRYEFLADSIPTQVWTARPDGRLDYFNQRAVQYFGLPPDDIASAYWSRLVHPDDRTECAKRWTRSLSTGEPFEAEYRLQDKGGVHQWHIGRAAALRTGGRIARWFGTSTLIQDAKETQLALEQRAEEMSVLAQELRYQRDLTNSITDNTASALFMVDDRGHPMFMNAAACAMTGYQSVEEIQHQPLHYSVHFRRPDGSFYPIDECPIDRANVEVVPLRDQKEVFSRKDGTLFPVQCNVAPLGPESGARGAVVEVRDITEQERVERTLRERAEQLARAATALANSNRELDQFAYVASHDLKAPLRGIANLAHWIEEDLGPALSPTTQAHMDLLQGRVRRMEALIDGILEYSRAGRSSVTPERVDTGALVKDVVELLTPSPGVSLELEPDFPIVNAERLLLQQVFLNLIGNALNYNTNPQPVVRVRWSQVTGGVEFCVQDNGPGIAPAYHQRIWGIFQTLEARDKVEGTGIGLALVKKIVESRGGRVWVESEEGAGATFKFIWPTLGP